VRQGQLIKAFFGFCPVFMILGKDILQCFLKYAHAFSSSAMDYLAFLMSVFIKGEYRN